MPFTEIIDLFKTKYTPSKIINSLERAVRFYAESNNDSPGNDSMKNLKNNSCDYLVNSYDYLVDKLFQNPGAIRTSHYREKFIIKLTDIWKIYQTKGVDFAALRDISLEIFKGKFLVCLGQAGAVIAC